ncbi:DegT/DnrJ/EryC1/StrS family aminotransferase [Bacillus luteolus]|uniref:DegT/DnrJ/EryC1/StrS family aminotransferase n=1 Tax=Litchfieldia luteola TaxID=682179 RepID=A0ABR9QF72_9BACI|nr:DegT/DnrJ/EryC1/StrS family aminotransferase [Cytobacillus luteolus]MBE4907142.1 DegT/DnrJ/EryC1/StrS family aminotransferase [Cytobacillus luteolus]MBP1943388.1 perosamine synthetase [Cytobacillus luteolus]
MNNNLIPHNKPTIGIQEEKAAINVLRSGWLAGGSEVQKFENEFCEYLGFPRGHAVAVSSGTAALYLALWSLDSQGKRVAFPAYTCSALRNATAMAGGIEMLVDNNETSHNMNCDLLNKLRPDIAIIPHMYGIPQNLTKLPKNIKIIEDCAQSLGAKVNGIPAGLQGDIGIYSFYATKVITSGGQGGMVVSKDKVIIDRIRDYRLFDQRKDHAHRFNFQMTDLQAAIGRVQLSKLPSFIKRREEIFQLYKKAGFPLLEEHSSDLQPIRFRAIIKTRHQQKLLDGLEKANIKATIPLKAEELLGPGHLYHHSFDWTQSTVSLPIYPSLKNEEVERVIEAVSRMIT